MKNLYRRIGLARATDDVSLVEQALQDRPGLDSDARQGVRFVLLHPNRKATYDKTLSVVACIGQLRSNLGLSKTTLWLESDCMDFDVKPSCGSQLDPLRPRKSGAPVEDHRIGVAGWVGLGLFALLMIGSLGRCLGGKGSAKGGSQVFPVPEASKATYTAPPVVSD
jgi:hypothetical protein